MNYGLDMDREQYEHRVAAVRRSEIWEIAVSRMGCDLGVDLPAPATADFVDER